jgi:hypothetical protein
VAEGLSKKKTKKQKKGCGVARLLARWIAVWQSQVRFPTWHLHGGLFELSGTCNEETQWDFNKWRWMYVKKYECLVNGKINKNILKIYSSLPTTKLARIKKNLATLEL